MLAGVRVLALPFSLYIQPARDDHAELDAAGSSEQTCGQTDLRTDLAQNVPRATMPGERSGGVTDLGVFYGIDEHFGIGIPECRTINPNAEPDWAARSVEPDVRVPADDTLAEAEQLAQAKVNRK
jgi:hypothetical protein